MKSVQIFIAVAILVGVVGCSTMSSTNVSSHHTDSATAAMIEDAKDLYEAGQLDAAEQKLMSVLAIEPNNRAARYYLILLEERQFRREASRRKQRPWTYYPTYPPKPIHQ